jgi:hypothetical protein
VASLGTEIVVVTLQYVLEYFVVLGYEKVILLLEV